MRMTCSCKSPWLIQTDLELRYTSHGPCSSSPTDGVRRIVSVICGCRICGTNFPRCSVTLSDLLPDFGEFDLPREQSANKKDSTEASGLCAPSESKLSAVSAGSSATDSFQEEQELYSICTIALLCLLLVEQELILMCANALLFLLVLVEQECKSWPPVFLLRFQQAAGLLARCSFLRKVLFSDTRAVSVT